MQRPFSILMVTEFPLDDPAGGINTMLRTLADELRPGCRVIWLEIDWNALRLRKGALGSELRYTLRLSSPYNARRPFRGFVGWAVTFPFILWALCRLITSEAVDIVHLHYASPYQYYFRIARWMTGTPYLITLHRGDVVGYPLLARVDRVLVRAALEGAVRVVAVSRWLAAEALRRIGSLPSLEVIENGIDIRALDRLGVSDTAIKDVELPRSFCLMVSNVARYKAQDVAIRAWASLRESHPDLSLLIVGARRELWDECVRLIDAFGCGQTVKLLGAQPRDRAIGLMRRAIALIIPSRSEGLPYVLLEAGALGTPVICSDIGPFTEVVEDGSSALVTPVEDHQALARAVLRLLEAPDRGRAMAERLSRRVRANFSATRMAERYLELYRRIVAQVR